MAGWASVVWCVLAVFWMCPGREGAPVDQQLNSALDPVQWKEGFGEDVYRAKRKFRPEEWDAANAILDLLEQVKKLRYRSTTTSTTTTTTTQAPTTTTTTTAVPRVKPRADRSSSSSRREDDDVPQFNPDGTIMLQLPGKLFGNATNFVLAAAKLFGDFITNTAIRTARFVKLFQPIAGRHLYIQIPTPGPGRE